MKLGRKKNAAILEKFAQKFAAVNASTLRLRRAWVGIMADSFFLIITPTINAKAAIVTAKSTLEPRLKNGSRLVPMDK